MEFAKPRQFTAKLTNKQELTHRLTEVTFEFEEPLSFIAGQFINLKVDDLHFRTYSIASDPSNQTQIILIIESGHEGLGSNYVRALRVGDTVTMLGPSGRFVLPDELGTNLEFFATGSGLAPYIAMFSALTTQGYTGSINLYFGVRNQENLFYTNLLDTFKNKLNFNYTIYMSDSGSRITKRLEEPLEVNSQYFLCGHPNMVTEIRVALLDKGIPEENIFSERFAWSANK